MAPPLRRIVTGLTETGKSTILFDGPLPDGPSPLDRYVWSTTSAPADNKGSSDAASLPLRLEPPANGSVFRVVEFPPASALGHLSLEQKHAFFEELFAALGASHCRVDTARSPGMHKTSTIDYVVVLRGEVNLLLDETEVTLKPGDVVVQRGTNHDWAVQGNEPAVLAVVMLPAAPL